MPQPTPVWFQWDGSTFLIYSQRDKPKLRNIAADPNVALHFNADDEGEQVFVLFGTARLDPSAPSVLGNPEYLRKYDDGIRSIELITRHLAEAILVGSQSAAAARGKDKPEPPTPSGNTAAAAEAAKAGQA